MFIMWSRNEVMRSVGLLRYRQGMSVQSAQTRGKGHIEIQCILYRTSARSIYGSM